MTTKCAKSYKHAKSTKYGKSSRMGKTKGKRVLNPKSHTYYCRRSVRTPCRPHSRKLIHSMRGNLRKK